DEQVARCHVLGVGVYSLGVLYADLDALLAQVRQEHVGRFDRLVSVPAASDDEAGAGGGHRVLSSESVFFQLLPSAELASTAARTRWTCSASSKDGEGSVPSPIAWTRSAIRGVKLCT